MATEVLALFIPILAVIGTVIMIIYLRKYENIERMAMIEKGVDAKMFAKRPGNPSIALRASLLLIGAGMGLLLGYYLDRQFNMDEVAYFSMLFMFGGIGLGIAYIIEEKKREARERLS